jgi:hypothetical protein
MQQFVDNASSIYVINGASLIKANYLPEHTIIDQNNPLVIDSNLAVERHSAGHTILSQDQINTYLASSVLLHTLDGWDYLSHSIESLLSGDHSIAMHLAYYSELRSTMSFLASEGIGIFNFQHLNVDARNNTTQHPLTARGGIGTHTFVWNCLDAWTTSPRKPNNDDLLKVFSVYDKTFNDWVNAFPFSASVLGPTIVKQWLRNWNLDVRVFRNDKNARNRSSYRPQRMTNITNRHSINEIIDKLNLFWQLIEPESSNKFQLLDKYLLRLLIQTIYSSLSSTIKSTNSLENTIKDTFNNLGLSHDQSLIDFLKDLTPITHHLFVESKNDAIDSVNGLVNPLAVIARATLMLRISTGKASFIFKTAGVNKSELDFLWDRIGIENGFWQPGNIPADFNSLWDDIKDHIDDIDMWARNEAPNLKLAKILENDAIAPAFNYFKQFHRAALWGISI